jgi:hypothetical protein
MSLKFRVFVIAATSYELKEILLKHIGVEAEGEKNDETK